MLTSTKTPQLYITGPLWGDSAGDRCPHPHPLAKQGLKIHMWYMYLTSHLFIKIGGYKTGCGACDVNTLMTRRVVHVFVPVEYNKTHINYIREHVYQRQVSSARASNYIPQCLRDVVTCPCSWYLLLLHIYIYIYICVCVCVYMPNMYPHGINSLRPRDAYMSHWFR